MKILHTSDWHLGQKFLYNSREEEHQLALNWLRETIEIEQIDCLIVAGDIFDIGNPPNYARRLYYQFLKNLLGSCCRHVVITGGNHDSPSMLDAPKELLQALNVYIVGAATGNIEDEILELKDSDSNLELVVAGVPFLRDRDVRTSVSGETGLERIEQIKQGIASHYEMIGAAVEHYKDWGVPIIATGHLYAYGAEASDKQDNIYIGDKENIKSDQFPAVFDYVALGHIHRAQMIGSDKRIYYSGSIIPLSFSETKDDKVVLIVDFEKGKQKGDIRFLPLPIFRRLKTITGTLEYVQTRLEKLHDTYQDHLTTWVEVMIDTDTVIPDVDNQLREFTKDMNLELLKIRMNRQRHALDAQIEQLDLSILDDNLEIFKKKCESFGHPPEEMEELVRTYQELENWRLEKEQNG